MARVQNGEKILPKVLIPPPVRCANVTDRRQTGNKTIDHVRVSTVTSKVIHRRDDE